MLAVSQTWNVETLCAISNRTISYNIYSTVMHIKNAVLGVCTMVVCITVLLGCVGGRGCDGSDDVSRVFPGMLV